MQTNLTILNASNSFDAMLEAFFCVQHNEHMKAWRWHQYTKNFNANAVDAALAKASRELCNASLT